MLIIGKKGGLFGSTTTVEIATYEANGYDTYMAAKSSIEKMADMELKGTMDIVNKG